MAWTNVTPTAFQQLPANVAEAYRRYTQSKNQASRVAVAREIYRWYALPTCDRNVLATFMTRFSSDIKENKIYKVADLVKDPEIIIPIDSFNHSFAVLVRNISECDVFVTQVQTALKALAQKPFGGALLMGISENKQANWPYVVSISKSERNTTSEGSQPCKSHVTWDPIRRVIGDGSPERDPAIGLAHELLHAYHYAVGVNAGGGTADDYQTVGIGPYWVDPKDMDRNIHKYIDVQPRQGEAKAFRHITENMIRHEWNESLRLFYGGMLELDDRLNASAKKWAKQNGLYDQAITDRQNAIKANTKTGTGLERLRAMGLI